jgi:uncharacterized repeat protein (TIGR04052 family)
MRLAIALLALTVTFPARLLAEQPVTIRFQAVVGDAPLVCGREYPEVGPAKSRITPADFRFYLHDVRVVNDGGIQIPVDLDQDGQWQTGEIALLDFENRTGRCAQGTPEMNDTVRAKVPDGTVIRGLHFRVGVPDDRNHLFAATSPPPLNLSAMFWSWSEGYIFMRLDYYSPGAAKVFPIHMGGDATQVDVTIPEFNPATDTVVVDLAALLRNAANACMGGFKSVGCKPMWDSVASSSAVISDAVSFFRRGVGRATASTSPGAP